MRLIAIDPGPAESAFVEREILAGRQLGKIIRFGKRANEAVLDLIIGRGAEGFLAIEMIASYGMPVGAEVFDTCRWIGKYEQAWGGPVSLIFRRQVKMFLCGNNTAKDGNIRQALIDLYGGKVDAMGNKIDAIGTKKKPGELYGVHGDVWAALAVSVTWGDLMRTQRSAEEAA